MIVVYFYVVRLFFYLVKYETDAIYNIFWKENKNNHINVKSKHKHVIISYE